MKCLIIFCVHLQWLLIFGVYCRNVVDVTEPPEDKLLTNKTNVDDDDDDGDIPTTSISLDDQTTIESSRVDEAEQEVNVTTTNPVIQTTTPVQFPFECFCTKEREPVCDIRNREYSNECVLHCFAKTDSTVLLRCRQRCPCPF